MVLEKDTLDIWVNGCKVEMAGEFTDEGTETHFNIGSQPAYVKVQEINEFNPAGEGIKN